METESVRRRWRKLERRRHMASKTTRITRFVPFLNCCLATTKSLDPSVVLFLLVWSTVVFPDVVQWSTTFSAFSRVSNRHHKGDLPISLASAVQVSNSDGKLGVTCDTPQNASRPWLTTACCLVTRCEANCEAITRPRSSHPIAGSVVESPSGCAQGSVSCLSNSNAPWSGLNPHPPDQQLKLFSRLTANGPKAKFLL
ncbi:hypothetical protein J3E69DRAFT_179589 [Trichoderma sp. SZMC 28015]